MHANRHHGIGSEVPRGNRPILDGGRPCSPLVKSRLLAKASGSTFPELSKAETAALQPPVPSLDEQRAIARVLAHMDDERVAFEARREKTRQLKQGMMQALLTGRIRLA